MPSINSAIEQHYFREGLFERIVQALNEQGIEKITRKDISAVDEFHVRGAAVSLEIAREIRLDKNLKILDVGCGIGGPCRMLAEEFGCDVTGIDITHEFIRTANLLSQLLGSDKLTKFVQGDALQLPFADASFDVVWTQHVQMNIEDKRRFYSEIKRVLKRGGSFIYYDIFKKDTEPLHFPVPWASDSSLSFLFTVDELEKLLSQLGFTREQTKDQTGEAIDFFASVVNNPSIPGIGMFGAQLIMGSDASVKMGNILRNFKERKVELQSGIYKAI